jgi:diaminohydroxyphosphoribosylaminopyrimidine deaminase / 5-amino-6-(5-phosphoribosylamino)uracil reductase
MTGDENSPLPARDERSGKRGEAQRGTSKHSGRWTRGDGDNSSDIRFLRRALTLTRRVRTHPNPCVGAVVVDSGEIVGEGWTRSRPGVGLHAEGEALDRAGTRARGATLYVTLEPCCHTRRPDGSARTPCTQRIIEAGVKRVVCCIADPNPLVDGQGFAQLRAAGITVEVGLLSERAEEAHAAFLKHQRTGLPRVTHKAALSLDGKISSTRNAPTALTGPEARAAVHRLRNRVDAVIVGVGTILADDPLLTTRLPGNRPGHDPVVVVFDTHLRTPSTARICRPGTLLITCNPSSREERAGYPAAGCEEGRKRSASREMGTEILTVPPDSHGRPDVREALRALAARGLLDVLLESGGALAASFWEAGLVDRAVFFVAPTVLGGSDAPSPVDGAGLPRSVRLTGVRTRRYGEDIAIFGSPLPEGGEKD